MGRVSVGKNLLTTAAAKAKETPAQIKNAVQNKLTEIKQSFNAKIDKIKEVQKEFSKISEGVTFESEIQNEEDQ